MKREQDWGPAAATSAPATPSSAALSAAPVAPLRPRRNPRLLILGILAICVGALASAALYLHNSQSISVLRLTHAVTRGSVLTSADLGVVSLPATPGVSTVRASELSHVVGTEALTDLGAGALLTPDSYGASAVREGTVHLGLKLGPGRAPARPVPVGTTVMLLSVPAPHGSTASAAPEVSYRGTVVTAPSVQADGTQILDVAVTSSDAARIAVLAASDSLVLVREGDR